MDDKLIFTTGKDCRECGTVVRIKPRAAAEIASDMIEFAYQHCEVQK